MKIKKKYLVSYVIWNKNDQIDWLTYGIRKSFPPDDVDLLFLLDDPIDGTDDLFDNYVPNVLKDYNFKVELFNKKSFKMELQNIALKYGYDNGYDWVICPQDDQCINDTYLLQYLKDMDINTTGLIGCRDGFNSLDFANAHGSQFSNKIGNNYTYLRSGEKRECIFLNDGPLIYSSVVIEKVGYHDLEFKVFYSEYDYSIRCKNAGLHNINLGITLSHEKFNCLRSNVYYKKHNYSELDSKKLREKWPNI